MITNIICVVCPKGCSLEVDGEAKTVSGNGCPRGRTYGLTEVIDPRRILTSTVRVKSTIMDGLLSEQTILPVRTKSGIPKRLLFSAMKEINSVEVMLPVQIGQVIIPNVCDTGIDVIASRTME